MHNDKLSLEFTLRIADPRLRYRALRAYYSERRAFLADIRSELVALGRLPYDLPEDDRDHLIEAARRQVRARRSDLVRLEEELDALEALPEIRDDEELQALALDDAESSYGKVEHRLRKMRAHELSKALVAELERSPDPRIPIQPAPIIRDLLAQVRPQARPREARSNGNISERGSPSGKTRPRPSDDDPDLAANGRPTGLQAALVDVIAELKRWRATFPPRDFLVLLDLLRRWLDDKYERAEKRGWRWS